MLSLRFRKRGMLLRQFGGNLWQIEHQKTAYFCAKWVEMVQIGYFVVVFITFEPNAINVKLSPENPAYTS